MKTPGQIAFEAYCMSPLSWDNLSKKWKEHWEKSAQTVLDSQWRSVDDPPEDQNEIVFVGGGESKPSWIEFKNRNEGRTHWMPIPKAPKSKDREDFEKWAKTTGIEGRENKEIAWKAWKAAKAIK